MILTGHQPNYLPYLGFFHKIVLADTFVIVDNTQFVKRGPFGWIHRNKIRTPEGWMWLTIPVETKGKFTQTIRETMIDNSTPWRRKHWKSIEWHYKKAPFFHLYADSFREIYSREWSSLAELNQTLILKHIELLGIKVRIEIGSLMNLTGKASHLVLELCRKTGADTYISGIHGKDYLDLALFEKEGIKIVFQDFKHPSYNQAYPGEFVPNLSTIDLLFNHGPESMDILMDRKAAAVRNLPT